MIQIKTIKFLIILTIATVTELSFGQTSLDKMELKIADTLVGKVIKIKADGNVGRVRNGDYVQFNKFTFLQEGIFDIEILASHKKRKPVGSHIGNVEISLDGNVVGTVDLFSTGNWNRYYSQMSVVKIPPNLAYKPVVLRLTFLLNKEGKDYSRYVGNFNSVEFTHLTKMVY